MKGHCDLPVEDLIAYRDGELRGARLEYTEAHMRACEICRERLADFDETGRLLDEGTPWVDDAEERTALKSRIHELHARRHQGPSFRILPRLARGQILVPTLLAVLIVFVGLAWPSASEADVGIAGVVRDMLPGIARSLPEGEEPPGTPLRHQELSPFVTPIELPGGFTLYHAEGEGHERLDLRYEDEDGRDFLLSQTSLEVSFQVHSSGHETKYVDDTQMLAGPGPYPGYLSSFHWERNEVRFHLRPLVPGAVSEEDAAAIVRHVVEVQDERSD